MKLIESKVERWEQQIPPLTDDKQVFIDNYMKAMYEHIERCGRVSYKSEDKIGEKDPKVFVDNLIKSKHLSVLEHGTVYLTIPCFEWAYYEDFMNGYGGNPYSRYNDDECDWETKDGNIYITTNYRVIIENNWIDDLLYVTSPTDKHPKRTTMCFTTDRGVTHEIVRHRKLSFTQESSRYCNYSKGKFNNEITFIKPYWYEKVESFVKDEFDSYLIESEDLYMWLIEKGLKPQEARQVLPMATKSDIVVTGFDSDWGHFFDLRMAGTTGAPHPDMKKVATDAYLLWLQK